MLSRVTSPDAAVDDHTTVPARITAARSRIAITGVRPDSASRTRVQVRDDARGFSGSINPVTTSASSLGSGSADSMRQSR